MLFIAAITAFLFAFFALPIIIKVFKSLDLLDIPDRRKIHLNSKPSFGGLAIFLGIILALLIAVPFESLQANKFLLSGMLFTFLLGFRDDISSLQAVHKLTVQTFAAFLVVYYGDISINSFHGLFGIEEINTFFAVGLSIIIIVGISNAFNLIDGIDGLAGSTTLIASLFFGAWFIYSGNLFFTVLSISLASATAAFLLFNWQPARLFMGDTGSIFIGFTLAIMAIQFINTANTVGDVQRNG
jgi:UDP-N-acetylmuramyl pentapeptide phosphotransferase/UDP-N-acetylglucosamine-1-phosphate transferase